ncbi:MAG: polysaccharide biosynthesis/export family protein [Verrucomicrobiota bacterium]|nr:polysaccharide biosynthesis/export family protein [Verrucomicrobiota bacterium]
MKGKQWVILGMVGLLFALGCSSTKTGPKFDAREKHLSTVTNFASIQATNQLKSEWLQAPTNFFTLGPGDRLEIEVLGDLSSRATTVVGPDGKIYYYLLPGIDVWGLTLTEARDRLQEELKRYMSTPQVAIHLRGIDSKRVWMLGRIQNPGVYSMAAPLTLLETLSLAGGAMSSSASGTTEDLADLSHSFIVRGGERIPVNFEALLNQGDMSQNIYLQPDDLVYFPSALTRDIYVLGAVRNPRSVSRQQNTLIAAVAAAGGPIKDAYLSHVAIVRGSLSDPKIAIVDYDLIVKGKAPDVTLEPRDLVYVPLSPYRHLSKYGDLILTTFVRAVAINEGARAGAGANTSPAGVSIPIITPTRGGFFIPSSAFPPSR